MIQLKSSWKMNKNDNRSDGENVKHHESSIENLLSIDSHVMSKKEENSTLILRHSYRYVRHVRRDFFLCIQKWQKRKRDDSIRRARVMFIPSRQSQLDFYSLRTHQRMRQTYFCVADKNRRYFHWKSNYFLVFHPCLHTHTSLVHIHRLEFSMQLFDFLQPPSPPPPSSLCCRTNVP